MIKSYRCTRCGSFMSHMEDETSYPGVSIKAFKCKRCLNVNVLYHRRPGFNNALKRFFCKSIANLKNNYSGWDVIGD